MAIIFDNAVLERCSQVTFIIQYSIIAPNILPIKSCTVVSQRKNKECNNFDKTLIQTRRGSSRL